MKKRKKWAGTSINGLTQHGRSWILHAALVVALAMAFAPTTRAGGVVSACDKYRTVRLPS